MRVKRVECVVDCRAGWPTKSGKPCFAKAFEVHENTTLKIFWTKIGKKIIDNSTLSYVRLSVWFVNNVLIDI